MTPFVGRRCDQFSSRGEEASDILAQRLVEAGKTPARSRVSFETLANQWQATVLPMYKPSTQKNHRHILSKHLMPRFGEKAVADITRQEIQAYVAHLTQAGYAQVHRSHARCAERKFSERPSNGAICLTIQREASDLPTLKTVRPKWVLTITQGSALLKALPPLARTMVGLALMTGLRRGELFALR